MIGALLLPLALAQSAYDYGSGDLRIRVVPYSPGQVVPLSVAPGYAAVVELGPDEHVDTLVVGNSEVWQVTASRGGDKVVVKPLPGAVPTNMVIVTESRRYVLLLQPSGEVSSVFVLRFVASPINGPAPMAASTRAADYKLTGAKPLYPIEMHDDGRRTSVTWDSKTTLPAIFAIDDRGREAIVNGRMVGGDYVIESVAARFVFRSGKLKATATRRPIAKK